MSIHTDTAVRIMVIGRGRSINDISTECYRRGCLVEHLLTCESAWPILHQLSNAYAAVFVVNATENSNLLTFGLSHLVGNNRRFITLIANNFSAFNLDWLPNNPAILRLIQEPYNIKEIHEVLNEVGIPSIGE